MATRKSKLPSPGIGGGMVTKTLMKLGSGLKNTAVGLHRAITGGPRQQTYGNIAELFPKTARSKSKTSYVDRPTSTATAIKPMPGLDTQEILDLMKRNFEQEKRYREVQKSFAEERASEEQERHQELIKALKDFTGTDTAKAVPAQEKKGGFLDSILEMFKAFEEKIKGMVEGIVNKVLDGISFLRNADLLGKLMLFLRSPIFGLLSGPLLMVGAIFGLAYLLKKFVDLVPDMTQLTPEQAQSILQNASERDIEKFGGRDKLTAIAVGGKEAAQRALDSMPELTAEERARFEKIAGATIPPESTVDLGPVTPKAVYVKNSRKNKQAAAEWWDQNFGKTHNEDGTPKRLNNFSPPPGPDASLGPMIDPGELASRNLEAEGGKAAFGVRPKGIRAAPVPPPPSPVSQLTDMNQDLVNYSSPMGDSGGLLVQQNDLGTTKNEGPLPVSAPPRDEEPMAAFVFKSQRRKAKAY